MVSMQFMWNAIIINVGEKYRVLTIGQYIPKL